jgi:hypothetical protein
VYNVKIHRYDQLEQSKICVWNVIAFGIILLTVRHVRPSLCRVRHHVAVGYGWQPLYRLRVILDLDSSNQSSRQVHHNRL